MYIFEIRAGDLPVLQDTPNKGQLRSKPHCLKLGSQGKGTLQPKHVYSEVSPIIVSDGYSQISVARPAATVSHAVKGGLRFTTSLWHGPPPAMPSRLRVSPAGAAVRARGREAVLTGRAGSPVALLQASLKTGCMRRNRAR